MPAYDGSTIKTLSQISWYLTWNWITVPQNLLSIKIVSNCQVLICNDRHFKWFHTVTQWRTHTRCAIAYAPTVRNICNILGHDFIRNGRPTAVAKDGIKKSAHYSEIITSSMLNSTHSLTDVVRHLGTNATRGCNKSEMARQCLLEWTTADDVAVTENCHNATLISLQRTDLQVAVTRNIAVRKPCHTHISVLISVLAPSELLFTSCTALSSSTAEDELLVSGTLSGCVFVSVWLCSLDLLSPSSAFVESSSMNECHFLSRLSISSWDSLTVYLVQPSQLSASSVRPSNQRRLTAAMHASASSGCRNVTVTIPSGCRYGNTTTIMPNTVQTFLVLINH